MIKINISYAMVETTTSEDSFYPRINVCYSANNNANEVENHSKLNTKNNNAQG